MAAQAARTRWRSWPSFLPDAARTVADPKGSPPPLPPPHPLRPSVDSNLTRSPLPVGCLLLALLRSAFVIADAKVFPATCISILRFLRIRPVSNPQSKAVVLLAKSALTGALGGLLFGFDTAVIAGATHPLVQQYGLTDKQLGVTVSIALVGTVLGAMFSGELGQKLGSRAALRWMGILYVISAVGCAFAPGWVVFLGARFLGGIGIGGSSVLGPVYIAELAPAKWRGRLVGLFQINIVVGILLAYLSNAIVAHFIHDGSIWRWEFGVAILPALFFLIMLFTVPHSSRWLVSQNRIDEAMLILARMGSPDSRAEVDAIQLSLQEEGGASQTDLFQRRYKLPIFLAITIGLFNQLTGINAILYYLNDIFASAGFSHVSANVQAVAIGAANLIATLLGISIIDKLGRKTLLLIGAAGDTLCLAGVAYVFFSGAHF